MGVCMNYLRTKLREEIRINNIVTIHYFEFTKDYAFVGESHNFWELVYVDKGRIEVAAETETFKLKQGDMIFHKPNEYHNLWANGKIAPNIIILSFHTNSSAMGFFENKILRVSDAQKKILAKIINEAGNAFSSDLSNSYLKKLEPRIQQPFGSEQLIKIHLEELLISLVRLSIYSPGVYKLSSTTKEHFNENQTDKIIKFMENNVFNRLSFKDISDHYNMSRTNLKVVFKSSTGMSVMTYYNKLKIDEAKRMIREEDLNLTQISEKLGYTSIHYFSRHFKKETGMTPSEYNHSVRSTLDS